MRKLTKLIRNPNQFFFDYFSKRIARNPQAPAGSAGNNYAPTIFPFDASVHPWVQLAKLVRLKSGALSGHPDQSALVHSSTLYELLLYISWMGHKLNCSTRLYTNGGAVNETLLPSSPFDESAVASVYRKLRTKPDFVVEFLGNFQNNFACHIFVYDTNQDNLFVVRSSRAFIKKALPAAFERIYPDIINEFGDWAFGTPWPVDIVYTWVNMGDPNWVSLWDTAFPDKPIDRDRYSSRDELLYSLRALCKFLPWFHKIHIVSNCSRPAWLKENPRINWVTHEDIFTDNLQLPTFNSHAIEACLHRIPGLSERFIYFNDDMFLAAPIYYSDFFDSFGRSACRLEPYGMVAEGNMYDETREYLAPAINCQNLIRSWFPSYFASRLHRHAPYALRKSILTELESRISDKFNETRNAKIRSQSDINITSFLYHHYALATGRAFEVSDSAFIARPENIEKLTKKEGIRGHSFICFNDGDGSASDGAYEHAYRTIMEKEFPFKSNFESMYDTYRAIRLSKTIMAHVSRADRIPEIRRMIGDCEVSLDEGAWGLWGNAKRSWLSYSTDEQFHMVIQDDSIVASHFYERLRPHLEGKNRQVLCLFFRFKSRKTHGELNKAAIDGVNIGGFEFPILQWANCLVISSHLIDEMVAFADALPEEKFKNIDDLRFSAFLRTKNIKTYYALPSLVDHRPDAASVRNDETNEGKTASWFADGINRIQLL